MPFDTIINRGTVIDGTGQIRYQADVGISSGKIEAIGKLDASEASKVIDASGLIVAPGFIDIHSHSDMSMFGDFGGESKAFQGVTTEVTGNCGFSPFPIRPNGKVDIGLGSFDWPVQWEWRDLDGWASALESQGISLNVVPQLGQMALQFAVGAIEDRPVTADEMRSMQLLANEAVEQGAFALSTGLSLAPSAYMSTDEVVALMESIAHYDGAFYVTHSRFGAGKHVTAIEEAVEIGRRADVAVQYSHLAILSRPDFGGWRKEISRWGHAPEMIEVFEKAHSDGLDISYDCHPYNAAGGGVDQLVPTWAQAGGIEAYVDRLKHPETRNLIRDEIRSGFGTVPPRFDTWVISDVQSEANQRLVGRSIADIADERDVEPAEATMQIEEEEKGAVSAVIHGRVERDTSYFLSHPIGMISSDGNAISPNGSQSHKKIHPRFYGTYPRILGRNVRQQSLMSLETAIFKMTCMPAKRLNLKDRGQIKKGYVADLTIFNPGTIIDHSTFEQPHQLATGVEHLIIAGEFVISAGEHTKTRPGRVLRRGA